MKGHQGHIIGETHCLPHKPVVRDEKATTKLQIVFDVSAKANESWRLNDCLYPGPSLTATLFGVLSPFWIHNNICWRYRKGVSPNWFTSIT